MKLILQVSKTVKEPLLNLIVPLKLITLAKLQKVTNILEFPGQFSGELFVEIQL